MTTSGIVRRHFRVAAASRASAHLAGRCIAPIGAALWRLPLAERAAIGNAMGLTMWLLGGRRRRATARNMALLLGAANGPRMRRLARAAFKSFGRMSLDFFALTGATDAALLRGVDISGRSLLDDALARGKGAILALPHLGSWDLAGRILLALGYPLTAVAEDGWGAEFVAEARAATGLKIVTRQQSLRPLLRALARNEPVALIADALPPGARGVEVPFAGQRASIPEGPARLAIHSGAPIIVCSAIVAPGGRARVWGSAALYPPIAGKRDDQTRQLTADLAAAFEGLVRQFPEQWYAFSPLNSAPA